MADRAWSTQRGNQVNYATLFLSMDSGIVEAGSTIQVVANTEDSAGNIISPWNTGVINIDENMSVRKAMYLLADYLKGWDGVTTAFVDNAQNTSGISLIPLGQTFAVDITTFDFVPVAQQEAEPEA